MQTAQSLSIPFPEFATFAALPQEDLPQEPLHSPILEGNLLNICKSEENSLPLRKFFLDTLYFRHNNMEVQIKENKIFAPLLGDISTETGRNTQQGYMEMYAGAIMGIRNPQAHNNQSVSKSSAIRKLHFASMLMFKLEHELI